MYLALSRIEKIYNSYGYTAVVTSTNDSYHKIGSLHYLGLAVDLRIKHLQKEIVPTIADEIRTELTNISNNYQVVLELNHIHVEFDRRAS